MKPVVAALGIGILILGVFGLAHEAWLGWLEVVVGVLALAGSTARLPESEAYTAVALGIVTMILWVFALAAGVAAWLTWLTFLFGVAFVLSSPLITRRTLPPIGGGNPPVPPLT